MEWHSDATDTNSNYKHRYSITIPMMKELLKGISPKHVKNKWLEQVIKEEIND